VLHEQVAVIEEIGDSLLNAFLSPCGFLRGFGWPPPSQLGQAGGQGFAYLGHRPQNGLGQFRDGVKLADLVRDVAEYLGDGDRIEWGTIRGDASQGQLPGAEDGLETPEEPPNVIVGRIMIKNLIEDSLERVVVHDGENAEGAVVQLVRGDVAGEARQRLVKILADDVFGGLFSPPIRPSSEWSRRGRTLGGRATDATRPIDTASRLPPPAEPPSAPRGAYSGSWVRPDLPCRR